MEHVQELRRLAEDDIRLQEQVHDDEEYPCQGVERRNENAHDCQNACRDGRDVEGRIGVRGMRYSEQACN